MPIAPPPPPPRAKGDQVSLVDSFKRIAGWLREHDGMALMQTLAPGAKPVQLSKLEGKLGFAVPPGVRALWLLHDGQRRAEDSLIGALHLLPVSWVLNERPRTLKLLAQLRAGEGLLKKAGVTPEEKQVDCWFPIASRGPNSMVVHATTGRVFAGGEASPFFQFVARSVPQWLETYADDVEAGAYELVHDPDGSFLARRTD